MVPVYHLGIPWLMSPPEMHEPLILAFVLPYCYVPEYYGPWVAKGAPSFTSLESYAHWVFHLWRRGRPEELPHLEGPMQGLWETPEEWIWAILLQFLSEAGEFPLI